MKLKMYAIKDIKAGKFASPFYAPNDELAKRMLHNTVNTEEDNNFLNKYAEDYQMFRLGTYSEEDGTIESEVEFLCNASEFKKTKWKWADEKKEPLIEKAEKELKGEFNGEDK